MSTGWQLVSGLLLIAVGVAWIWKREIPVGIEGEPPAFHARGILAVILGIAAILIGLVVTFDVPRHLQVDSCLDGGGSFDYEKNVCDFSVSHPIRTQ
jgi:hypothetical protein